MLTEEKAPLNRSRTGEHDDDHPKNTPEVKSPYKGAVFIFYMVSLSVLLIAMVAELIVLSESNNDKSDLESQIISNTDDINDLMSTQTDLNTQITDLTATVSENEDKITSQDSTISANTVTISDNVDTISDQETSISDLTNESASYS